MFVPAAIDEQPTIGPTATERSGGIIEIEIGGSLLGVGRGADADTRAAVIVALKRAK
jgi:hypothetical protein